MIRTLSIVALHTVALLGFSTVSAQVTIYPETVSPADWERFALRVVNVTDTPTVAVQVRVPNVITILGVESPPGWSYELTESTDSIPQEIRWSGGELRFRDFREFVLLGRVKGDAQKHALVFPVTLTRANGSVVEWTAPPGRPAPAPRVAIVGTGRVSTRGAILVATAAMGVGIMALIIALATNRRAGQAGRE